MRPPCRPVLAIVASGVLLTPACSRKQAFTPVKPNPAVAQPVPASLQANSSTAAAQQPWFPSATGTQSQSDAPRLVSSEQTQGPFRIRDQSFTLVKHSVAIEGSKSQDDATVDWWELRDRTGKTAFRQEYSPSFQNGTFSETLDVNAREARTQFGQGILVEGGWLPSAPNSGWWVQLFGLFDKKLVSFGTPIMTDGKFMGEAVISYRPTAMMRGPEVQPVSQDVLRFKEWTGNFNIVYDVVIDWMQAKVRPAWTCRQMTSKGQSSACRYEVQADPVHSQEMTFVRLFSEPDEGFTAKHVVIKPDSKIEVVEAQVPVVWTANQDNTTFQVSSTGNEPMGSQMWLHIRVDGVDGWISGEEDFEAIGLPQSG